MKANKGKELSCESHSALPISGNVENYDALGRFFALLLQIDKRNHPEWYESQKSRNRPYQTT